MTRDNAGLRHWDVEVNWLINDWCNFDCRYCYPNAKRNQFAGPVDAAHVAESFDRTDLKWLIYISGGEPFLAPDFVDLCKRLITNHTLSLNTNLSPASVHDFAEAIDPVKIRCVHCSLHIEERERLGLVKDFLGKFRKLEEKGFYAFASYVLYPALLGRFEADYEFFKKEGIILRPKLFRGTVGPFGNVLNRRFLRRVNRRLGKTYPGGYTKTEKQRILAWMDQAAADGGFQTDHTEDEVFGRLSDVLLDRQFIDELPSFKGRLCDAGQCFAIMESDGTLRRCHDDRRCLGNLFNGDLRLDDSIKPCRAEVCHCPYIGYAHAAAPQTARYQQ